MVAVLVASSVLLLLSLTVWTSGIRAYDTTRIDRKRVVTIHAAEGGVDLGLQRITAAATATALPCALSGGLQSAPSATTYTATFTYYATTTGTGPPMTCPTASMPQSVRIRSTATSSDPRYGGRRMEVLARIQVTPAGGSFDRAIFSASSTTLLNSFAIAGTGGDVYAGGNIVCGNSIAVSGSLLAQGDINLGNSCTVGGDVRAHGSIGFDNSGTVDGDAITSGAAITQASGGSGNLVKGAARAAGTISVNGTVEGGRFPNMSPPPARPPTEPFPQLNFVESAWTSAPAGWIRRGPTYTGPNACTDARANLLANHHTWSGRSLVHIDASCELRFLDGQSMEGIRDDLAIVTRGRITFVNSNTFRKPSGAESRLMFINPYDTTVASCPPAPTPQFHLQNSTEFTDVAVFLYTPCRVTTASSTTIHAGQIYGSPVEVANSADLVFRSVGIIPGFVPAAPGQIHVVVDDKREVPAR
jgi:hypothetical protein